MDRNDYYDHTFFLKLTWEANQVTVQQVELTWNNGEAEEIPVSEKIPSGVYVEPGFLGTNNPVDGGGLISFGEEITNLILPALGTPITLRDRFRRIWNGESDDQHKDYKKIRLCLLYPKDKDQLEKLLRIPSEYAYLTRKDPSPQDLNYLLGLRDDISIVHWLPPYRKSDPIGVEKLSVNMKYLSWFPSNEGRNEVDILNDFIEELPRLKSIIHYQNISDKLEDYHAEPADVENALQTQHFVHVTSHGGDNGVIVLKDEQLTPQDLDNLEVNSRAVVFLNCLSAAVKSIAIKLHQDIGVPVVIGMTRSIDIPPARRFVDGFYKAIATWPSHGLEKAVVSGRNSIFTWENGRWSHEFGFPRLFLNSPDSTWIPKKLLYGSNEMVKGFDNYICDALAQVEKHKDIIISNTEDYQKKLNEWVHEGVTRWFFMSGQPGSGKSAQIARFVNDYMRGLPLLRANVKDGQNDEEIKQLINNLSHTQQPKLLYHFCRSDQPETGDPLTFVQSSLVPQLIQHFGEDYYKWCPSDKYPLLTDNAKDALIDFVYIPLCKARELDNEPPVIVVDSLDFIPLNRGFDSSILGLLHDHRDQLNTVARFIVTADANEDKHNEWKNQILNTITELTHQIAPLNISPPELSDDTTETYLGKRFTDIIKSTRGLSNGKGPGTSTSKDQKKQHRAPTPLLERMMERFKDFLSYDSLVNILSLKELASSQGLDKLYEYAWGIAMEYHQKEIDGWEARARQFLDVVALAYEPLLPDDIAAIIDVKADEMDKLLMTFWPFFADREKHDTLKFFHHSLKNYVLHNMRSQNRTTSTHRLFVDALLPPQALYQINDNTRPDWVNLQGTKWRERYVLSNDVANNSEQPQTLTPSYTRRYLSYHAYEHYLGLLGDKVKNRRGPAKDFLNLICEPGFRTIRLAEVGRDAVEEDIRHGLRVVYTEYALLLNNGKKDRAVKAIDQIMRIDEFVLQNLEQQLRSDRADVPALFKFLGLKTKWRRLKPPQIAP